MLLPLTVPEEYNIIISVKDKVTAGQIIAKKDKEKNEKVINIPSELGINPKQAIKTLKKTLGESVSKGDLIASKSNALGLGKKKIISDFSGTLVRLEEDTGKLTVKTITILDKPEEILSPLDGIIEEILEDKIILKTEKEAISVVKVFGQNAKGKIKVLKNELVDFDDLPKEHDNTILIGKTFTRTAIFKAFTMGIKAVVLNELSEEDFNYYDEKEILECLVLLNQEEFAKIEKLNEREALVDKEKKIIIIL